MVSVLSVSSLKCKLAKIFGLKKQEEPKKTSTEQQQAMPDPKTSSLSNSTTTSNNSTLDQQKPLIVGSVVDEQQPDHMPRLLQSTAKRFRMFDNKRVGLKTVFLFLKSKSA